jgi:hypothetical protein
MQELREQGVAAARAPLPPAAEGVSLFGDGRGSGGSISNLKSEISNESVHIPGPHGQPRQETTEASRQAVAPGRSWHGHLAHESHGRPAHAGPTSEDGETSVEPTTAPQTSLGDTQDTSDGSLECHGQNAHGTHGRDAHATNDNDSHGQDARGTNNTATDATTNDTTANTTNGAATNDARSPESVCVPNSHGQPRQEATEASRQAVAPEVSVAPAVEPAVAPRGAKVKPPFPSEVLDMLDKFDGMLAVEVPLCV